MPSGPFVHCQCTLCLRTIPTQGCIIRKQDHPQHLLDDKGRLHIGDQISSVHLQLMDMLNDMPNISQLCELLEFSSYSFQQYNVRDTLSLEPCNPAARLPHQRILTFEDLLVRSKDALESLPSTPYHELSDSKEQLLQLIDRQSSNLVQQAKVAWQRQQHRDQEHSQNALTEGFIHAAHRLRDTVDQVESKLQYLITTFGKPTQKTGFLTFKQEIPSLPALRPPSRNELDLDLSHSSNDCIKLLINYNSKASNIISTVHDFLGEFQTLVTGPDLDAVLSEVTKRTLSLLEQLGHSEMIVDSVLVEDWVVQVKRHNHLDVHIQWSCPGKSNVDMLLPLLKSSSEMPTNILNCISPSLLKRSAFMEALRLFMGTSQRNLRVICDILNHLDPTSNDRLPLDHRVTRKRLGLVPSVDLQALCPGCGKLHGKVEGPEGNTYPSKCDICQANLLVEENSQRPIRPVAKQDFHGYISRMLNNPLYQNAIDQSWKHHSSNSNPNGGLRTDFWDADFVQTIPGPPNSQNRSEAPGLAEYFCKVPPNEIRLCFALSVDWYNPLFNKESGRKVSIGPVFLTCLNLPIEERYKVLNMFLLYIIPGPKEPSVESHHLNNAVEVVVKLFEPYWDPGVFFTRTSKYELGCIVRLILALVICDLPGARKITGLPHHNSSEPCSVCHIKNNQLQDIAIADNNLYRRTDAACRAAAEKVKGTTKREKDTGIRYSPLYRLPYFSPTKMIVIDVMHTLLLNVVHHHFADAYGIQNLIEKTPIKDIRIFAANIKDARHAFIFKQSSALKKCNKSQLLALVCENDEDEGLNESWTKTSKAELLEILEKLRTASGYPLPETADAKAIMATETGRNHVEGICHDLLLTENPRAKIIIEEGDELSGSIDETLSTLAQPQEEPYRRQFVYATNKLCKLLPAPEETAALPPVFLYEELEQLNELASSIICPTWVTRLPENFGTATSGKIKADEWRFLILVHAPLVLTSLWAGNPSRYLHLKNLLYLSIAVKVAISRTVTDSGITLFQRIIRLYLKTLQVVAPTYDMVISHHLSLHIHDDLRRHGPSPTHWQFPTEQAIGMLGSLPHNFNMNTINVTLVQAYAERCQFRETLKSWVNSPLSKDLTDFVSELSQLDKKTSSSQSKSCIQAPASPDTSSINLPSHVRREIASIFKISLDSVPYAASKLKHIHIAGRLFRAARSETSEDGNSRLLYGRIYDGQDHNISVDSALPHKDPRPLRVVAQLWDIYAVDFRSATGTTCTKIILIVRDYQPVSIPKFRGLEETEFLGLTFLKPTPSESPSIILVEDVISHVAQLQVMIEKDEYLVSISLDRGE